MVIVTLLALYPLLLLAQQTLVPALSAWPLAVRVLVTSAVLVSVMTYAAMPAVTKVFSRWLYARK